MYCHRCGSLNPDQAQRCYRCSTELRAYTSNPNEDIRRLEKELATAQESINRLSRYIPAVIVEGILHDQKHLRGERREMAVLFADTEGFTHLSASLDAESAFDLINDLLGRLIVCVHRYGGMVGSFTGDGLLAVFGVPNFHENNAEMAVRAALDMQKAAAGFAQIAHAQLGAPIQIRIGIHSGPAIAGIIGTDEQAAYTVIGETVNLAARLETITAPGDILVSTRVYAQTRSLFAFEEQEAVSIKGVDNPVVTYRAMDKRATQRQHAASPAFRASFLGRQTELPNSTHNLHAFLQEGKGRIVSVRGEAGMGKSRLVAEWLSTIDRDTIQVWQGRGLPYVTSVGYGVFRSLLNNAISNIRRNDRWISQISASLVPFLKQILEMPLTPTEELPLATLGPEQHQATDNTGSAERLLKATQQRPLVIVLDDLQWADDLSRDALRTLST